MLQKFALFFVAASLSACGASETQPNDPPTPDVTPFQLPPIVIASPSPSPDPPAPTAVVPQHLYDERRGETYYYIAAVSEEDRARGIAVGRVNAFQYLGQNADGEYVIASLRDNGSVSYRAKCAINCRIIDTDYGQPLAYSPRSIIGSVFQDAWNGELRVAQWALDERQRREEQSQQAPVQTAPSSPPSSSPTQVGDTALPTNVEAEPGDSNTPQ